MLVVKIEVADCLYELASPKSKSRRSGVSPSPSPSLSFGEPKAAPCSGIRLMWVGILAYSWGEAEGEGARARVRVRVRVGDGSYFSAQVVI